MSRQEDSISWIRTIRASEWDADWEPLKAQMRDPRSGEVDHILAVHSLDRRSLEAHFQLYRQAMRGTRTLPKVDREMVALVVSLINECHY